MRKNAVLYLLERLKHWFFVTFDIIVSYIFPWKFHWNSSSRSVVGIRLFLLETWREKGWGVKLTRPHLLLAPPPPSQKKLLSKSPALLGLNNMPRNKSPGNDGLTKEFYQLFRHDIKATPISSFRRAYYKDEESSSQRQAVIRAIQKKDKEKRYIQNRRPISSMHVDTKHSKVVVERLKKCLPFSLSPTKTTRGWYLIYYRLRVLYN